MRHNFHVQLLRTLVMLVCAAGVSAQELNVARQKLAEQRIDFSTGRWVQYAAQGDNNMIRLFLEAGMPVDAQDDLRRVSALHNAAAQGHLGLVQTLLEKGANPNLQDWRGATPLINAAFAGQQPIVKYLLAHGAKVNIVPVDGPTALVAALQGGSEEIVTTLLQAGADRTLAGGNGLSPLTAAELSGRSTWVGQLSAGVSQ